MTARPMVRLLLLASSSVCAGAAAAAAAGCSQGVCAAARGGADLSAEAVLLQHRSGVDRGLAVEAHMRRSRSVCNVGDAVQCPGSPDVYCTGEQCCPPGTTGDLNFPCPSATPGWGPGQCQRSQKIEDCVLSEAAPSTTVAKDVRPAPPTTSTSAEGLHCAEGDVVRCPLSDGATCAGAQCCPPAAPGHLNYPCPSAPAGWGPGQCQNENKVVDCLPGGTAPLSTTTPVDGTTSTETPVQEESTTAVPPASALLETGSSLVVVNECADMPLWIGSLIPEEYRGFFPILHKLSPGENKTYTFPHDTTVQSTRFWPKWGCDDRGANCIMGDSGGPGHPPCPADGCAPPVDTKFEATFWDHNTAEAVDWWDTSGVDGYTLPFKLELDSNCPRGVELDCSDLKFADCPDDEHLAGTNMSLKVQHNGEVKGCYSTCGKLTYSNWGNTPIYGVTDDEAKMYCCPTPPVTPLDCSSGPVEASKYVALFRKKCKHVYSYAYDDAIGLQTCPVGTTYTWRLYCPK